jgi:hypothetical protein
VPDPVLRRYNDRVGPAEAQWGKTRRCLVEKTQDRRQEAEYRRQWVDPVTRAQLAPEAPVAETRILARLRPSGYQFVTHELHWLVDLG